MKDMRRSDLLLGEEDGVSDFVPTSDSSVQFSDEWISPDVAAWASSSMRTSSVREMSLV